MFKALLLLLSSMSYQDGLPGVYFIEKHNIEPNTTEIYSMRRNHENIDLDQ